jgi:phosphomannomutase/phosphoglucomutase
MAKHTGSQAIIEVKCSQALVDEVVRLGGRPFF